MIGAVAGGIVSKNNGGSFWDGAWKGALIGGAVGFGADVLAGNIFGGGAGSAGATPRYAPSGPEGGSGGGLGGGLSGGGVGPGNGSDIGRLSPSGLDPTEEIVKNYSKWIHRSFKTAPNSGFNELKRWANDMASDSKRVLGTVGEGILAYDLAQMMTNNGFIVKGRWEGVAPSITIEQQKNAVNSWIDLHPHEDSDVRLDVDITPFSRSLFVSFNEPDGGAARDYFFWNDVRFDFEVKTWKVGTTPATTATNLAREITQFAKDAVSLKATALAAGYKNHVPVFMTDAQTWMSAYSANPTPLTKDYNLLRAQNGMLMLKSGFVNSSWGHLHALKRLIRM